MDEPNLPVTPINPVPPAPKNHTLVWIFALILVALVSGLAVYFWFAFRPVLPTKSLTLVSSPTTSATQNWLTYQNADYGFQFIYPSTWNPSTPSPNTIAIMSLVSKVDCVYFNVYRYSTDKSLSDYLKEKYHTNNFDSLGLINNYPQLNNKETIAIGPNDIGEEKTVFVKNGQYVYEISVNLDLRTLQSPAPGQCDSPDTSHYDQILSTFKFTSPSASPNPDSNVKTFTSANLGISFNYLQKQGDETFAVKELGNKVYLYSDKYPYTQGQYVEVFKNPTKYNSLDEALTSTILKGYDPQKCILSPYGNKSETTTQRVISPFANSGDDLSVIEANAKNCPSPYTATNGIAYFQMDNSHTNTFVFFSIGQYPIEAGDKLMWQDTFKFTN